MKSSGLITIAGLLTLAASSVPADQSKSVYLTVIFTTHLISIIILFFSTHIGSHFHSKL